jgi:hypothetical protein
MLGNTTTGIARSYVTTLAEHRGAFENEPEAQEGTYRAYRAYRALFFGDL